MFKETKARSILGLLGKNLSAREAPKVLGVSRNTVAEVQALSLLLMTVLKCKKKAFKFCKFLTTL